MEWRPVPGYEGSYEVSETGQVRSLPRATLHYTGKVVYRGGGVLRGCFQKYHQVSLSRDGKAHTHHTHVLVATAFLGPRPQGMVARHVNGDRTNNAAANIVYGTHQENSDDMRQHGTVLRGSRHGSAKLTEDEVLRIRELAREHTYAQVAAMFDISIAQAGNIVRKHQWRHV